MSKKRFSLKYLDNMHYVKDNLNGDEYYLYWAVEWMNELIEENEVLKEENEQLRKELDSFNPIMFNDMQKGTIILYSKGGIDE